VGITVLNFNILTASYNSEETIQKTFISLNNQRYDKKKLKWLVLDGKSEDESINLVQNFDTKITKQVFSEKDEGLYFAYNKGISLSKNNEATIINFLDSDNEYANENVLSEVSEIFKKFNVDVVFSDLIYTNSKGKIIRYWSSKPDKKHNSKYENIYLYNNFRLKDYFFGWSMPLPTIFIKSDFLRKVGPFNTKYSIASDYDWSLRMSFDKDIKVAYVPKVFVKMKLGGVSNKISNLIKIKKEDFKIIQSFYNHEKFNYLSMFSFVTLLLKNIRKLPQFFIKRDNL
jgi:glycosyltransferase